MKVARSGKVTHCRRLPADVGPVAAMACRSNTIYSHQFPNAQKSAAWQSRPKDPWADFLLPLEHVFFKLNRS